MSKVRKKVKIRIKLSKIFFVKVRKVEEISQIE
jgi:hypothetical protein